MHRRHLAAIRPDVAGNGDVDEHDALLASLQSFGRDDGLLACRGREDDIAPGDDVHHLAQWHHLGVLAAPAPDHVLLQHQLSLFDGAVDDGDIGVRVLAKEGQQQQPRHLAGAQDADVHIAGVLLEIGQSLRQHQLDGGTRHGHAALADLGLRPGHFAHADGGIQHLGDDLAARAGRSLRLGGSRLNFLDGMLVAGFYLRQDLSLAKHEGVQAGADLEKVVDGFLTCVREEVRLELVSREAGLLPQEGMHALDGGEALELGGCEVELESVACREHSDLRNHIAVLSPGELDKLLCIAVPVSLLHRKFLPDVHRCLVVAQADDMDLHHGVEALLARGPVAGEGLHSILLHFANPGLGIAVHLMENLPQLALADVLRRVPETVDGVHQGAEELIHLGENPSQFGFPQLLHRAQHVLQLTAPQQFGLVLQRRNFGHDVGNGLFDIVEPASRRELIGSRREGIAAGSVEGGDPEACATLHSPPRAPSPHSSSAGNEAAEESGDGGLPAAIGRR
mmetsp:Transcript_91145/g.294483  ORF Transcript_91145/g.294483 Transcript_91145/m.294483 type:complete len:509 (-) Transcript_91145:775-2301(-)